MKAANSRAAENKLQVTEKEETKEYRVCRNLAVAPLLLLWASDH